MSVMCRGKIKEQVLQRIRTIGGFFHQGSLFIRRTTIDSREYSAVGNIFKPNGWMIAAVVWFDWKIGRGAARAV